MNCGIYRIINVVNNKVYIGNTLYLDNRWKQHKWYLNNNKHPNRHLQSAWNKDKSYSFDYFILERCEPEKLLEREQFWIDKYKAFNDNITKNFNVREAHTAIQEYNKSLENLTPKEAKEADKLAREQLGLLVGKFDAGAKSNPVTSLNQLGSSILKYVNTGKFHTKNPAVGEAAMKRLNSAIKMAGLNKASGRDSVFQTQFNLSNAFGGIISGQTVPEEKINGLLNSLERRSGGALQQGLAFSSNKEAMKEAAKETFGDYFDDYLGKYNSLNKKEKEKVGKSFAQPEMEEGEVIETDKEPMTFDQFNKLKKKSSLLNEFRQGRQA